MMPEMMDCCEYQSRADQPYTDYPAYGEDDSSPCRNSWGLTYTEKPFRNIGNKIICWLVNREKLRASFVTSFVQTGSMATQLVMNLQNIEEVVVANMQNPILPG